MSQKINKPSALKALKYGLSFPFIFNAERRKLFFGLCVFNVLMLVCVVGSAFFFSIFYAVKLKYLSDVYEMITPCVVLLCLWLPSIYLSLYAAKKTAFNHLKISFFSCLLKGAFWRIMLLDLFLFITILAPIFIYNRASAHIILLSEIQPLIYLIWIPAMFYLWLRIVLVYVNISVHNKINLRAVFNLSKGHAFKIFSSLATAQFARVLFLVGLLCAFFFSIYVLGSFFCDDALSESCCCGNALSESFFGDDVLLGPIMFFTSCAVMIIILAICQYLGIMVPATMAHLYKQITQGTEKGQRDHTKGVPEAILVNQS